MKNTTVHGMVKYKNKLLKSVPKALLMTANRVLQDSNELVPVNDGTLRNSGDIYQDPKTGETQVFYDTEYAVYVHEDLSKFHPNGEAKFLEKALYENKDEFLKNMKRAIEIK